MYNVKVCRICLVQDVNMENLLSHPLETCYKLLVGNDAFATSFQPMCVCYECAAHLKKLFLFRSKCIRAQAALGAVLQSCGEITGTTVQEIDRQNLDLSSNLCVYNVLNVEIAPEIGNAQNDCNTELGDVDPEIKDEPWDTEYLDCEDKGSIKLEDGFDDGVPSTDDDEPLSVHKERESGRKVPKDVREINPSDNILEVAVQEEITFTHFVDKVADTSTVVEEVPVEAAGRRKRGRPRKSVVTVKDVEKLEKPRRTRNTGGVDIDDIDLEQYCTIVQLSEAEQKEEIAKRQQSSNYANALYKCNLCYKGFIDALAWKHHVTKHDPSSGDVECHICKFRFKTKRTLMKHNSIHDKRYACKACPYVSKTTTQAKQHQRWHKGVTYKCQYCDEILTKWTSYLSHVRMKHPSEFICGVCGYSFVSKLGLGMHKTMMHKDVAEQEEVKCETGEAPYCAQCDVKFVSVEAYKRHMVTSVKHTQSTDFKNGCRVCGESFPDSELLRVHHRRAHAKKRPRNYGKKLNVHIWPTNCEHCSAEIASAREYWAHFRKAHPDQNYPIQKNYVCDVCGKSFRGNAFLIYHKRTHSNERAFKCQQCPKSFFNRTNLQMHEKTHSDHRPHPCSVCAKAFKNKGALDRHFRSHTGEKPYECEVCGKAFAQSNSRKLHVFTVHLKQPSPYISRSRLERRNMPSVPHSVAEFLY